MKRLILTRLKKEEDRTLGRLLVFSGLDLIANFTTLELPFKNNERGNSSILSAFYYVEPRTADRFKKHLHVVGVPGRDYILIHAGNWPKDTNGCILVGSGFNDIDGDGKIEIMGSRKALNHLTEIITEKAELIIL